MCILTTTVHIVHRDGRQKNVHSIYKYIMELRKYKLASSMVTVLGANRSALAFAGLAPTGGAGAGGVAATSVIDRDVSHCYSSDGGLGGGGDDG